MGGLKLTNKVRATIIFAVITFLATQFGLNLDKQTETLINALVPVIIGYLWVEDWDSFTPNTKILAAAISAIVVYATFRFGVDLNKGTENLTNVLVPVIVAVIVPQRDAPASSGDTARAG
jgi:UDP-N-acetylmuramyl pentapeptide phosphotransferase/UDP-N-acetylglucosamine-1-phosphate transferase